MNHNRLGERSISGNDKSAGHITAFKLNVIETFMASFLHGTSDLHLVQACYKAPHLASKNMRNVEKAYQRYTKSAVANTALPRQRPQIHINI